MRERVSKIIMATHNEGKVRELKLLLDGMPVSVQSAHDVGIEDGAVEDGDTVCANAMKKARHVWERYRGWVLAEDTGLFVDALDGQPGVHSARWAGVGASDEARAKKLLHELKSVPADQRQAAFRCCVTLLDPAGTSRHFHGEIGGQIAGQPTGRPRAHMPYDVVFVPAGHERTFAQMSIREKTSISHRARALDALKKYFLADHSRRQA